MTEQLTLAPFTPTTLPAEASIQQRFDAFHAVNPWVFTALEQLAARAHASGRRRVGMKHLFEVLRWEWEMHPRYVAYGDFMLNNSFSSRYARALLAAHPDWADLIETRALKAA